MEIPRRLIGDRRVARCCDRPCLLHAPDCSALRMFDVRVSRRRKEGRRTLSEGGMDDRSIH